jgi:molybdopterin-guanine dinucleotide biosynthesis protein A
MRESSSGAILAGGRARRFGGRDKCRLLVGGRPIIVRQVDVLQRVVDEIFVVSREPDRFKDLGLAVHVDRIDDAGAIGGIYTAIEAAAGQSVLVVACDLPFLDGRLLAELVDRARGRDGAWVRTPRGVEPLLACYRKPAGARVRAAIDAGRLRASDLGDTLDMAELGARELARFGAIEMLLTNVNTPADYARVQYGPR